MENISFQVPSITYPAIFKENLLAESLPDGTYRFTQKRPNQPLRSVAVDPVAGYAYLDTAKISDGKKHLEPRLVEYKAEKIAEEGVQRLLDSGEALLRQYGVQMRPNQLDLEKLLNLDEAVLEKGLADPERIQPGDCLAYRFGSRDSDYHGFTAFQVRDISPDPETSRPVLCYDSGMAVRVYKRDRHTEIHALEGGVWGSSGGFVELDPSDFQWLTQHAYFFRGNGGLEEGKKLYVHAKAAEAAELSRRWETREGDSPFDGPDQLGEILL